MLTRSEIIAKAAQFSDEWKDAKDEDAEAKSFWDALFLVFGTPRKNVARFEVPIKRTDGTTGFIDVLWKGKLLVEHKSKGKSLVEARRPVPRISRPVLRVASRIAACCDAARSSSISSSMQ